MTRNRVATLLVLALVACRNPDGTVTPQGAGAAKLEITGIDNCVESLLLDVRQPPKAESHEVPVSAGTASATFTGFQWQQPVVVVATVRKTKPLAECELFPVGLEFVFTGVPTPTGDTYTIPYSLVTLSAGTDVGGFGKVHGGISSPDPTGQGSPRAVMWHESTTCTQVCWEQWAQRQFYLQDPAGEKPLLAGVQWQDNSGGQQTYGVFGRDTPTDSVGNCYPSHPIPNHPGKTGIKDGPGVDTASVPSVRGFWQRIIADPLLNPRPATFSVRIDDQFFAILWCEQPPPRRIVGYFQWSLDQRLTFTTNQPAGTLLGSKGDHYEIRLPRWRSGTEGLEDEMK